MNELKKILENNKSIFLELGIKIYLFGSLARGSKDITDIDIAILINIPR